MSQDAMKQHGAFSWNELSTSDVGAAKTFYGELLGWQFQDIQCGDMAYTMIKAGDQELGGLMETPAEAKAKGQPPSWGAYVTVDDVDAQVARVAQLNGKVLVPPSDIPDVGRFAVIQDPQGATLMLITYLNKG